MSGLISYILLLRQNIQWPQVKGEMAYFSSQCVEVLIPNKLGPRQGRQKGTAEEEHSQQIRQSAGSCKPSFPFYFVHATSFFLLKVSLLLSTPRSMLNQF